LLAPPETRVFQVAERGDTPIASEAVVRIAQIYAIEKDVRGTSADKRYGLRHWDGLTRFSMMAISSSTPTSTNIVALVK
jgi:hypothetical protein